ncbi:putative mitochondrial protein [Apostasia shenzhenica]|uniref:Putative mitochondrial protein n=1 Tax=Apostasia shenzhenica TaxID=1088818 RepID=A0A2I0ABZ1_9ASPA|nr:putative mitochondrial protein [Apostasia shenzhenica]
MNLFSGQRIDNVYKIDLSTIENPNLKCLSTQTQESWLWHRRLGHASMHTLSKISRLNIVRGLPKISFDKDHLCDICQMGKQVRSSFKSINDISTTKPLELLHMDLFWSHPNIKFGGKTIWLSNCR